jgi:hypothetical protein
MTDLIASLVASGRIAEIAAAFVVAEALLLGVAAARQAPGGGRAPDGRRNLAARLAHLAAGFCLLMALRAALQTGGWQPVAAWLLGGLIAHVGEIVLRLGGRA